MDRERGWSTPTVTTEEGTHPHAAWGMRSSFAGTNRIKFAGSAGKPSQRPTLEDRCTPEQRGVYAA